MTKVELYEAIRRDRFVQGKSIREIAQERKIHRRMVRAALASAVPAPRQKVTREAPVFTAAMKATVDGWLRGDVQVHRKQRHTSARIYVRLQSELDYTGASSTVRRYVAQRRRELGRHQEVFIPLAHAPGEEAEVDWYEADVEFPWGIERVQFFQMRACYSGREFHMAFPHQTQQAFLEAHVAAFSYFGGVFARVRYDNLKAAVTKVLRGRRREEADRFVALRSHYLFASEFCRVGVQGAHEKGGVEGGVGRFRRNHLVPVPVVASYEALNLQLLEACVHDDLRVMVGRSESILTSWKCEAPLLRTLPKEAFQTCIIESVTVNAKSCAMVRQNSYSVPVRLAGRQVETHIHANRIDIYSDGRCVATHDRLRGKFGWRVALDHYLELLRERPNALGASLPLKQARAAGHWPAVYDTLWSELRARHGDSEGTRQLVDVLMLHRGAMPAEVEMAVQLALEYGCRDAGAISVLLRQLCHGEDKPQPLTDLGHLACYNRPALAVNDYNQLLRRVWPSQAVH